MKALPGRAAEPVLRLPPPLQSRRCGTVTGLRVLRPAEDERAREGKACAANSSLAEPLLCTPGWIRIRRTDGVHRWGVGVGGPRNLPVSAGFGSLRAGAAVGV